jgi:hypothetical protein
MRKYILLLIALAIVVPTQSVYAANKNKLVIVNPTPRSVYLNYVTGQFDAMTRLVRISYTDAQDAYEAQNKLDQNRVVTVFKRRATDMRITGLKENTPYCFKAWHISPQEFRYLAPLDSQVFDESTATDWVCTNTSEKQENEVTKTEQTDQGFITFGNDLLIHSLSVDPKLMTRAVVNYRTNNLPENGNLVTVYLMNAGDMTITDPLTLRLTCAVSSARAAESIITQEISTSLPAKSFYRVNVFIPRTMSLNCGDKFIADVKYIDDAPSNNEFKFGIEKKDNIYTIQR